MTYKLPEPDGLMTHGEFIGNVFIRPSAWNKSQMQAAYAAGLAARVLKVWQVNNRVFSVLFATEAQADKFIAANSPATGLRKTLLDVFQPEPKP